MGGFIEGFFGILFNLLGDLFSNFFDVIINLLSILPGSPFAQFLESVADFEFLGYMNYFIPFQGMATVVNVWVGAITLYYVYKYVRKYTDYIQQFTNLFKGISS